MHEDISEFGRSLPPFRAIAGLDLGTKTVGVAVSDGMRTVATPLETVKRRKFGQDAQALLTILKARDIAGIVLGLPRNMDGSEGPRCQSTRAFARNFSALWDGPVSFWDERLSTVACRRLIACRELWIDFAIVWLGDLMKDDIWSRDEIESPCVKICVVHPESRLCTGCLRTIDEIGAWSKMSPEERRDVMAELPERKGQLTKRRGGRAARLLR